jgi:hypothetical protein
MKHHALAIILILGFTPNLAHAWSADGHQMTAIIALQTLDKQAHAQPNKAVAAAAVRAIAKKIVATYYNTPDEQKKLLFCKAGAPDFDTCKDLQPIAAAAIFPDQVRSDQRFDAAKPWHFINTDNQSYDASEGLIPKMNEYTHKIEVTGDLYLLINGMHHYLKTLHATGKGQLDKNLLKVPSAVAWSQACGQRAYGCETEALSFLIHFVGDVHQPLHVSAACDRGGNSQYIKLFGQATNPAFKDASGAPSKNELHAAWDGNFFDTHPNPAGGANIYKHIDDLATIAEIMSTADDSKIAQWQSEQDVKTWVDESLSYMPTVYDFGLDGVTKNDQKNGRKVAQAAATGESHAGKWDSFRCQEPPLIPDVGVNYQKRALVIMKGRVLQGGVRLATLLADIYGN